MLCPMDETTTKKLPVILIDARMVSKKEHGISQYVTSIARQFADRKDLPFRAVFLLAHHEKVSSVEPWNNVETVESTIKFLHPYEIVAMKNLIREIGASAFHSPSFASFIDLPVPHMQTIHDLNHLAFGNFAQKLYYRFLLRPFARKAKVLATVSKSARSEIARWMSLPENEIEVHYNAFSPPKNSDLQIDGEKEWLRKAGIKQDEYFLAVGSEKPHKNFDMLRLAHQKSQVVEPMIFAHELMPRVSGSYDSDFAFPALMRNARGVFSPSTYEGFGRVAVEAVLYRTPLVASAIKSHIEIFENLDCQSAVALVEPTDQLQFSRELLRLSQTRVQRPNSELGDQLLKRFSEVQLGTQVIRAYEHLLS